MNVDRTTDVNGAAAETQKSFGFLMLCQKNNKCCYSWLWLLFLGEFAIRLDDDDTYDVSGSQKKHQEANAHNNSLPWPLHKIEQRVV